MSNNQHNLSEMPTDEVSIKDLILKTRSLLKYLKQKIKVIIIVAVLGAVLGAVYAFVKKPVYTATCSFVLEEGNKSGGAGQYAAIASLVGLDLGGGSSGIFSGDNIVELYKSRTMLEKTLLCKVNFNGKQQMLIDRYIDFNNLREAWKGKPHLEGISFNTAPASFNRYQDSIITDFVEVFNQKLLNVGKPDKKLTIIAVSVSTKDELFSKAFVENLVSNVNSFYVQTKTKKSLQSVQVLQHQSDSVRSILNGAIGGVASAIDATPNANPALLSLRVPSQRKQIDVQASTAVYAEMIKNLELSKISLRQETPLIQVIDSPVLPLAKDKPGKVKTALSWFILGGFLSSMWFSFIFVYRKLTA